MNVFWTIRAGRDLKAIYAYLAEDSSYYASMVVDDILRVEEIITLNPAVGMIIPGFETQNLRQIFRHNYRIIYRVTKKRIDVLTVVHMRPKAPRLA